ncbi:MAG: hypothetical protein HY290_19975 [Planctomycetia bacterium]|nr:hypothetical protein [Planctomycetia bacterium]
MTNKGYTKDKDANDPGLGRPLDTLAGDYINSEGRIVRGGSDPDVEWVAPLFGFQDFVKRAFRSLAGLPTPPDEPWGVWRRKRK